MPLFVAPGNGTRIASAPGAMPVSLNSLGIGYVTQRPQANWCWAACTVMVASHLKVGDPDLANTAPTMCHLASVVHSLPNCCTNPEACDMGAWPEPAYAHLRIAHHPDVPSPPNNSERTLTIDEIRAEIRAGRPIEVLYKWSTRGAHVALITGVYADGQVEVLDPWFGVESPVSYDYVRGARGLGRWAGTYFEFQRVTGA